MENKENCTCELCNRSREYKKYIELVENLEAKKWFTELYNYLYELEEDLACHKIYAENLRTLYPRISKEVSTIKTLTKDEAEFPEKQL